MPFPCFLFFFGRRWGWVFGGKAGGGREECAYLGFSVVGVYIAKKGGGCETMGVVVGKAFAQREGGGLGLDVLGGEVYAACTWCCRRLGLFFVFSRLEELSDHKGLRESCILHTNRNIYFGSTAVTAECASKIPPPAAAAAAPSPYRVSARSLRDAHTSATCCTAPHPTALLRRT